MINIFLKKTDTLTTRQQSEAAHELLKENLSKLYSVEKDKIEIKKDSLGCPYTDDLENAFISISHCEGMIACAVSDSRVGIDVEALSERRKRLEKRIFTENEIKIIDDCEDENTAFFTLWTLKEAYLKAIGTGFRANAKEIEFSAVFPLVVSNKPQFVFKTEILDEYILSYCEERN